MHVDLTLCFNPKKKIQNQYMKEIIKKYFSENKPP